MGDIQIIRNFYSLPEQTDRTLRIFTPDAYREEPNRRFPVLYMFDGQNIFSHPESALYDTWCANTTLEILASQNLIQPWIIVGIDHLPNRLEEYSPGVGGQANLTAEFLVNHLKPYIDKTYRTLPESYNTAVMGSSLGGLFSLYLGKTYPQIFGRIGGISPALMLGGNQLFKDWNNHTRQWSKILLHVGSKEQFSYHGIWLDFVPVTQNFYEHLKSLGYADYELRFILTEGDIHHETSWQKRLPDIMTWLLEPARGI